VSEPIRAFFAARVPDTVATELEAAARTIRIQGVRPVPAKRIHLTLRFIGPASAQQILLLKKGADQVAKRNRAIKLRIGDLDAFPARRPTVVAAAVDEKPMLTGLATDLELLSQSAGFKREQRRFRPHITVARLKGVGASSVQTLSFSGAFDVTEIVLFQSELTPDGPIYRVLHTAKLLDR